ncbi:MAG: helix-turn-helix transcriptional regulator, partial [Clostridia bacterium]|nr:helix-turn-helix transcriptional regulator [Clostridia bacterium]
LFIEKMGGIGCENLYGKILSILHTGYMRKIRISDIAAECHYSASFISRYFKEKGKKTVNEYLFNLRMEKAGELICNSDMRIEDISASVGFSDANYFISCFSSHFGISPKKYRNANKK